MVFTDSWGKKRKSIKQMYLSKEKSNPKYIYTKVCHKLNWPYYFSSSLYSLVVVNAISSLGYDIDINKREAAFYYCLLKRVEVVLCQTTSTCDVQENCINTI